MSSEEHGEVLRMSVRGSKQPESELSLGKRNRVMFRGLTTAEQIKRGLDSRPTIPLVFFRRWDAFRLTEIPFGKPDYPSVAASDHVTIELPVEALNHQCLLLSEIVAK